MLRIGSLIRWALTLALVFAGFGSRPEPSAGAEIARRVAKDQALALARQERAAAFATIVGRLQSGGQTRVIVRLNTGFAPEAGLALGQVDTQRTAIADTATALQAELGPLGGDYQSLERLPYAIVIVDAAGLAALQASPLVAGIQEDIPETTQLADSGALIGASGAFGAHAQGYTGAGYAIAILDNGVDKLHPFLQGRVVAEACFSTTGTFTSTSGPYATTTLCPNAQSTQIGTDSARPCSVNNADPTGVCDHGTHVAGIAAGRAYNTMTSDSASAVYNGVAPDSSMIAVQVFSRVDTATTCGGFSQTPCYLTFPADQLRALDWLAGVAATYNLAAVNMSLGGSLKQTVACDSDSRKAAIDDLRAAGIPTFIASGNTYFSDGLVAPACISSAISVGSVKDGGPAATPADVVSSFSNSASMLSLLAPGEWIQSATTNRSFTLKPGTSMATPHAAGAWVLYRQMYPGDNLETLLNRVKNDGVPVTDARNGLTRPRIALDRSLPVRFTQAPTVGFGQIVIDLASTVTVTLSNPRSLAVTLGSPTLGGSGVSYLGGSYPGTGGTCASSLAARSSCTIVLRYAPTTVSTLTGQLSVSYATGLTAALGLTGAGRQLCPGNLIANAVFENGTGWAQTTSVAGVLPLRTSPVVDGTGPAAPANGSGWARFGGYTGAGTTVSQMVGQSVTIPTGSATLEFIVDVSRADAGATAAHQFQAAVDGTPLFTISALDRAAYAEQRVVRLNLNAYANGGAHQVTFAAVTPAGGPVVNFNLDAVGVCSPAYYPHWLPIIGHE